MSIFKSLALVTIFGLPLSATSFVTPTQAAEVKQSQESLLSFDTNQYSVRVYQSSGAILMNVYDKIKSTLIYDAVPAKKIGDPEWLGYQAVQDQAEAYARYNPAGDTELELIDEQGKILFTSAGFNPAGTEYTIETRLAAAEGAQGQEVTVPPGTTLRIILTETLKTGDVKTDDRFSGTLEDDLNVNGMVVAPRGATVYGRVVNADRAGRIAGKARLSLELTEISINGQLQRIITSELDSEGDRSGTLGRTATGAAIGAIVDGGDGAATGAAIAGGLSVISAGDQIEVPANSVLSFTMLDALTVEVTPQ